MLPHWFNVPVTPADRRRAWLHIYALAEQHRVKVRKAKRWDKAEANVRTRQVWVPPRMSDRIAYLIALHEIGHVVHGPARRLQGRFDSCGLARCEAAAWSWAVEHAYPDIVAGVTTREWEVIGFMWASNLWVDADGSARFRTEQVS